MVGRHRVAELAACQRALARTFARADGGAAFQVPGRSVRFSERAMVPREGITHNHRHSELLSILNELLFILNMVP